MLVHQRVFIRPGNWTWFDHFYALEITEFLGFSRSLVAMAMVLWSCTDDVAIEDQRIWCDFTRFIRDSTTEPLFFSRKCQSFWNQMIHIKWDGYIIYKLIISGCAWWFFFPDVTCHYLMWLFCIAAVPWGWCDFPAWCDLSTALVLSIILVLFEQMIYYQNCYGSTVKN